MLGVYVCLGKNFANCRSDCRFVAKYLWCAALRPKLPDMKTQLRHVWRSYWAPMNQSASATRALMLTHLGNAFSIALVMALLTGFFTDKLTNLSWWLSEVVVTIFITVGITYPTLHALYRGIELALPAATAKRMSAWRDWHDWRDWRAGVFVSVVGISGALLGGAMALTLTGRMLHVDAWGFFAAQPQIARNFLLLTVLIMFINWLWVRLHTKRQAQKLQATESQLRLLQAQIEPHFLFNTLANVQSLMDHDTQRARLMLEAFTEYLRASLSQLRNSDCTLDDELAMAQSYLSLLQIRMDQRLRFVIEADNPARAAIVPPLLLQPLVENAIHHGLEPKIEGGQVCISASVKDGRLKICVDDDGLGLNAPRRGGRSGHGVALENIRTRLKTRYADNANLSLQPLPVGTRVCLNIPYNAKP